MSVRKSSFFGKFPAFGHEYLHEVSPLQSAAQKITFSSHVFRTALCAILAFVSPAAIAESGFQLSGATTKAPGNGAQVLLYPSNLRFGTVDVGDTAYTDVSVVNRGTVPLTISRLNMDGQSFFFPTPADSPITVAPQGSYTFKVGFRPATDGPYTGDLTIQSTATNSPGPIHLTGWGSKDHKPQLSVTPGSLTFEPVDLGAKSAKALTLSNTGSTTLTVSALKVSGSGFTVAGGIFPMSIGRNSSVTLQAEFAPSRDGSATGQIEIDSNSTSSPVTTVAMAGSGTNAAPDAGEPRLSASAKVQFGDVNVGNPTSQTVTLLSSGTGAVEVTSATVVGAGFSIDNTLFPITLNPNQQISLPVQFSPAATGAVHGEISFTSNSLDGASTVSLAANGVARLTPQLSVAPGAVSFGSVTIGNPVTQNVTFTSTGGTPVTVSSVRVAGTGFTLSGSNFPLTLKPGEQATVEVKFNPTANGVATGQITVNSTSSGNPVLGVQLSGTGAEAPNPQLAIGSSTVNFGSVTIGRPATQVVTLTSTGTSAVTVNSAEISGAGYTVSEGRFPVTLDPGQKLTLDVQFSPTATGAATGQLAVNSTSSGSPVSFATLTGIGTTLPVPKLSVASSSGANGAVTTGNRTTQSVTLTSSGTAPVTVNSATVSGTGFTVSGSAFPATLNPGQQFTLDVQANPETAGVATGNLTVNSTSADNPTASVPLSATPAATSGAALTVSPTSVNFSSVTIGWPGTRSVTLTSTGTASVTVNSATISGAGLSVSGSSFPVTLSPKQTLTLQVKFNPTVAGTVKGQLTIKSNSSSNPTVYVPITATAAASSSRALTVSSPSISFGTVTIGSPLTRSVTLTSTGSSSVTVNSTAISGAGFSVSGSSFPVTLSPKQTLTLQVKFNPTATGSVTGQLTIKSTSSTNPTVVVSLSGTGSTTVQHRVSLAWSPPTSTAHPLSGYRVYRATGTSTSYTRLNSTLITTPSYVDTSVQSAMSYTYYATSVDNTGVESAPSNKTTAKIP